MPALPNPKQEVFAQALAKGLPASRAYVEAGWKNNRSNAASMARKQHIQARVDELVAERVESDRRTSKAAEDKVAFDKAQALQILADIADGQEKAADRIRAVEAYGKLVGWAPPTRLEVGGILDFESLNDDELDAIAEGRKDPTRPS